MDEHVWHHRDPHRRGPKALTGMAGLTRGTHPTARLLDLVLGRSGTVYRDWLDERGERFREGIEIARLGKTLGRWKTAFLAYFDTDGASNSGTEAINGIIELGRRVARGFRKFEHYRLSLLLIAAGLDASPHTHL